jgi:glycosyltransferase involved in cell wall biosynthesis
MRILKLRYKNIPIFRLVNEINEENLNNGITLIANAWYKSENCLKNAEIWPNSIILANTQEEYEYYNEKTEANVIFCNQNAFLNEERYKIIDNVEKKNNMVISSCFSYYKNVHLAKNIDNVLHIGYINSKLEYIPDFGTRANFINNTMDMNDYRWICNKMYTNLLNSSLCGGIFSLHEGACFSSSEYLLCGLPVISTLSKGGRDIFYNNENSIICDANVESVLNSFNEVKNNINFFDKYKIRENHLIQMDYFRNILTEYVKDIIEDKYNESVNFNELKTILKYYDNSNIY